MTGEKVGQEQIHELLFKETLSWQAIIYDLINSEQLDPWNIDLSVLSQKYLEKVKLLEEANFFISSKVLLAASLLLRLKSEILLEHDIPGLDEILYGKKEAKKPIQENIEFDEDVPLLIPRTPLPRFRRVTLDELMSSLGKAIATETRRIKRTLLVKQQEFETAAVMPKRTIQLQEHIGHIFSKLKSIFSSREEKLAFSSLLEEDYKDKEKRIMAFVSLLHLDNQQKILLEQEGHFEEIWILLKEHYLKQNKEKLEGMMREVELASGDKIDDSGFVGEPLEDEDKVEKVRKVKKEDIDEFSGFGKRIE
ncbi:MAG: segregation/condensation protein A [Nanoarchaeota archaeon]